MRRLYFPLVLVAAFHSTAAVSQVPPSPPPLVVGGPTKGTHLPEGTEIPLRTLQELNSDRNRVGDRFDLEVAQDVQLNGRTVIPAGTRAVGEVTRVVKKGMFGKSGKLDSRVLYVKLGDRQLRVRGTKDDKGAAGTAATVATLVFIWPAAFFVTGKAAVLPPGTTTTTYLEQDLPLVFADSPTQVDTPLVVGTTTPKH